jgi:hypothetical protein
MLRLSNRSHVPTGGFRYTQPESGLQIDANSFDQLMVRIKEHRDANGYPININIEAEVEDQVCRNTTTGQWCREIDEEPAPRSYRVNEVLRFSRMLANKFIKGGERVEQATANARAAICAGCPDNNVVHGCDGCGAGVIQTAIRRVTGAGVTPYDSELKTCRWCGCFNAAQVWFPLEILKDNMSEEIHDSLPEHCWKK